MPFGGSGSVCVVRGEGFCFLPLPASGGCWHSLACGYSSPIFKASISKFLSLPSSHGLSSVCASNLLFSPSYKDICDLHLGSS